MQCRSCGVTLEHTFCDLGMSPMANSYVAADALGDAETFYPLHAYVCSQCLLVQLLEFESPDAIFSDYAYFSSFSSSWVEHAKRYVEAMIPRFGLTTDSLVVEVASNDGYLLQHFVANNVPVLGIEPAANVAAVARANGIRTLVTFFGSDEARRLVAEGHRADLLIGNNVLAHVPDLNDVVAGLAILLADDGRITMEFPHLLQLILHSEFDTIYHEHFSYFSLISVRAAFARHGLRIFDVEELPTHGGSIRIFACHKGSAGQPDTPRIDGAAGQGAGRRSRSFGDLPRLLGAGAARKAQSVAIHGRSVSRGQVGRRIRRPSEGQHIAQLLRRGRGHDRVHRRSESVQAGLRVLPGTRIPIYAPEHIAATDPTTC